MENIKLNARQSWKYNTDLETAQTARDVGLEGRSRVSARRAASVLVSAWMDSCGENDPSEDALQIFTHALNMPQLNPKVGDLIQHFVMSVDKKHNLPKSIDLIDDCANIIDMLNIEVIQEEK